MPCISGNTGIITGLINHFTVTAKEHLNPHQWCDLVKCLDGFFCGLQQFTRMRRIVVASFLPLAVQHMKLIHDMQDVHHLFVKLRFLNLSV